MLAVTTRRPSGDTAAIATGPRWPRSSARERPEAASQRRAVPSRPAVTTRRPGGEGGGLHRQVDTVLEWPRSSAGLSVPVQQRLADDVPRAVREPRLAVLFDGPARRATRNEGQDEQGNRAAPGAALLDSGASAFRGAEEEHSREHRRTEFRCVRTMSLDAAVMLKVRSPVSSRAAEKGEGACALARRPGACWEPGAHLGNRLPVGVEQGDRFQRQSHAEGHPYVAATAPMPAGPALRDVRGDFAASSRLQGWVPARARCTMNRRAALWVTLSMAVPAVLYLALVGWYRSRPKDDHRFAPVLTRAELQKMTSFERRCALAEDCEPSLGCAKDDRIRAHHCLASECDSDSQCEYGFVCRAIPTEGPLVRICVSVGTQPELGSCEYIPSRKETGCRPGLLCNWFSCGRPCRPGEPSDCSLDATCMDGLNGPSCVPSCARTGCPPGKECITLDASGISICGVRVNEDCVAHPCPENQRCDFAIDPKTSRVRFSCEHQCDRDHPCPQGTFCFAGECRRPCERGNSETCEPHEVCVYYPAFGVSACELTADR